LVHRGGTPSPCALFTPLVITVIIRIRHNLRLMGLRGYASFAPTGRIPNEPTAMSKSSNNVVTLPADSKLADQRHAQERAEILSNINTADDLANTSLVAGIAMTVTLGLTSADEVGKYYPRASAPKVYASQFNLGFRLQEVMGHKAALELIAKAQAGKGAAFHRVVAACRAALAQAKQATGKAGAAVDNKSAKGIIATALAQASAPKPAKTQDEVSAKRGTRAANTATLAKAAAESGESWAALAGFALLLSQRVHAMADAEGRETICQDARRLAEELADTLSPMIRKSVRKAG